MQMAASYQVWGALLAPIAIPLLVGGAALLSGREIWISPFEVLAVVAQKQFAPLLAGMALMRLAPGFSTKVRRPRGSLKPSLTKFSAVWAYNLNPIWFRICGCYRVRRFMFSGPTNSRVSDYCARRD